MSTSDLRDLKFAAGYDLSFLAVSVTAWYWLIRPARRDAFRPNPRDKLVSTRFSETTEDDVWDEKRCHNVFTRNHWLVKLWNWDIKKYASTDVYLYLLFQRTCSILFFTISMMTLSVGFPIIWSASLPYKIDEKHKVVRKSFFDRAVITNVPVDAYFQLWVLYGLVWAVFIVAVIAAVIHFKAVRSDEFRSLSVRRKMDLTSSHGRFMPNKYTIAVHGIDRNLRDTAKIRTALLHFYDEEQITCINLVMDYSEAFYAQNQYTKAVDAINKIQKKIDKLLIIDKGPWWKRLISVCSKTPRSSDAGGAHVARRRKYDYCNRGDLADPLLIVPPASSGALDLNPSQDVDSSSESYEECDSLPASPTLKEQTNHLPSPEKFRVHVGQLPFTTLDSAVLSPKNDARTVQYRSPRQLTPQKKKKLEQLQSQLEANEEIARTRLKGLESLLIKKPTTNTGTAFVCFSSWEAARFALTHDLAHPACPVFRAHRRTDEAAMPTLFRAGSSLLVSTASGPLAVDSSVAVYCASCKKDLRVEHCRCGTSGWNAKWRVHEAPPPEDIVWANMSIGRLHRAYRIVVVNIAIFLLLFTLTSSTVATALLFSLATNLEKVLEKASFFKLSVSGWLAPLFLYLINALLLPFLVSWGANASRFWKRSSRDRTVLYANVHYMVINSLIFPVLGTTSFQTLLLFFAATPWNQMPSLLGRMAAGASGSFVVRYLMNTICINTSMQLMQLPMFSQQRVLLRLGKRANRWDFDYGFWYAFHLAVFSVCIVFAVDFPLVPLGGAVFFTCKFWVDKYNLTMKVWRTRSESAGAVASSAVSFIFYFISLYMFLMAGYFFTVSMSSPSFPTDKPTEGSSFEYGSSNIHLRSRVDLTKLPTEQHTRGLAIGALILLLGSLNLATIAVAEKAQRSIFVTHANSLHKMVHKAKVRCARWMEKWGITAPLRGVLECEVEEKLPPAKVALLEKSYVHPFECGNRLNLVVNQSPSVYSGIEEGNEEA